MGNSRQLFLYFHLFNTQLTVIDSKQMFNINKFLQMTGFKLQTSGIRSNRSTNWVTTTALLKSMFTLNNFFINFHLQCNVGIQKLWLDPKPSSQRTTWKMFQSPRTGFSSRSLCTRIHWSTNPHRPKRKINWLCAQAISSLEKDIKLITWIKWLILKQFWLDSSDRSPHSKESSISKKAYTSP